MLRKALTLVAATAMVALTAPSATAATSVTFTPQTVLGPGVPRDGTGDQNVVALGSVTLDLAAAQSAKVEATMRVNSATVRTLFDNEIVCQWAGGGKNAVLGQNVYQKGSGSPQREDVTLTTSQLVDPATAARVTCTAFIRTASLGWDDSTVALVSGSMRITPLAGKAIQAAVPSLVKLDAANPITRQPAIPMFDAPARTLDVVADTEYMVCHTTGQCDKTKTSKAAFTLIVNQWKEDGTLCQTDSTAVSPDTPYWVHHVVVPLKLQGFQVKTDNGCIPRFNAYVLVKWLSGETGAVQGIATNLTDARGSASRHNSDMSAIHVVPST